MYNLPLPMLKCYVLKPYALRLPTCWSAVLGSTAWRTRPNALYTVLCGDLYTVCVDASRTVFWDRSYLTQNHRIHYEQEGISVECQLLAFRQFECVWRGTLGPCTGGEGGSGPVSCIGTLHLNRMTDTTENITLSQLRWRAVTNVA